MTNQHRAKYLIAATGVLGLVLGGCAAGASAAPGVPLPPGVAAPASAGGQPAPVSFTETELDADDQRGDGVKAVIEEAGLPKAGHVAVYDSTGKLLGSAPIQPGAHRDVAVTLNPALGKGEHRLRAVLVADDGDGRFDPAKDAQVREFDTDDEHDDDQDDDDRDDHEDRDGDLEADGFRYTVA